MNKINDLQNNDIPIEVIQSKIYFIRKQKVMFDRDLAELYVVTTGNLNKAVTRNKERFPEGFMFRLTKNEFDNLIFHFGISSWGGTRKLPRVFTEQGIAMLSSVLRSHHAIQVNILIIQTFVKLRKMIASNNEILSKIDEMEIKYDRQFKIVFDTLRDIMIPKIKTVHKIGFIRQNKNKKYNLRFMI